MKNLILIFSLLISLNSMAQGLGTIGNLSTLKMNSMNSQKEKQTENTRELATQNESKKSHFDKLREKFNKKQ